jgi:hypothetical protein
MKPSLSRMPAVVRTPLPGGPARYEPTWAVGLRPVGRAALVGLAVEWICCGCGGPQPRLEGLLTFRSSE